MRIRERDFPMYFLKYKISQLEDMSIVFFAVIPQLRSLTESTEIAEKNLFVPRSAGQKASVPK